MQTTIRWLLVALVVLLCVGCFSGRRKTGTNTNIPHDGNDGGPWSSGEPAAVAEPGR